MILDFNALSICFPFFDKAASIEITKFSTSFLKIKRSLIIASCCSNCLASLTALSISMSDIFDVFSIVILCIFPLARSLADTLTIPFASISNVTSICGTPRIARLIFFNLNLPRLLLSLASGLSPCKTLIST